MPINDLFVLGFIVSMFAAFMLVLGGVAWWSEQPGAAARARTQSPKPSTLSDFPLDLAA
jgi:hypothetical protein